MLYDVCVIGAGTMGSSTAYHLSKKENLSICLVGSDEPENKTDEREVFGCHYDEGRITRIVSEIDTEQILAYQSTLSYSELERESGLHIFTEVGMAVIGPLGDKIVSDYVRTTEKFCEEAGLMCDKVDKKFVQERWTFLAPSDNCYGCFSKRYNGYISVRSLVRACQIVAKKNGAKLISEVATSITKESDGHYTVVLENGNALSSKKIVVACGSFTNFYNLMPDGKQLDLQLLGHTVLKFELDEKTVQNMAEMPSMMCKPELNPGYVYVLPPITYPNRKTYLKIGHIVLPNSEDECGLGKILKTSSDVQNWYCQGDFPKARKYFQSVFKTMYPDVKALSEELDFCVMAFTASGKQMIGFVEENFVVATGGNGKSAKMGLQIGKICADSVVKGDWDCDVLDPENFKVRFKDEVVG